MTKSNQQTSLKQLLAEELQKVAYRRQGGKTHSMTKAEVIADRLINRAMAGDRPPPRWLLEMFKDLRPPPDTEFRFDEAESERELLEAVRRIRLRENDFDRHER